MKRILLIVLFFSSFVKNVFAIEPNQAEVSQALIGLYSPEGSITKNEYDEFWQKVGVKNRQEKEKVIAFMKDNFLLVQDYQRETWKCAEDCWKAGRVIECNDMKKKLDLMQVSFRKIGQESSLEKIKENSNSILKAASTHGQIELPNAQKAQISLETIKKTRANLDKIFEKLSVILRVDY